MRWMDVMWRWGKNGGGGVSGVQFSKKMFFFFGFYEWFLRILNGFRMVFIGFCINKMHMMGISVIFRFAY